MSRKARESAATKILLQHVESRSTGRLSIGARAAEVSVWVLQGQVVAATGPSDERVLVRLAGSSKALGAEQLDVLTSRIEHGESIFGDLLEGIPAALSDRLLQDRFRANLAEYLGSMSKPGFSKLSTVFVDNLQMGNDTSTLIAVTCELADSANALDLDLWLQRGPAAPVDAFGRDLHDLLAEPTPASALISSLAWEPILARAWLRDALDAGIIQAFTPESAEDEGDWSEDDATEHDAEPLVLGPISEAPEPVDDPPTPDTAGVDGARAASTLLGLAGDEEAGENTEDQPSPMGDAQLASVRSWLSKAHAVEESELDFFEDHDSTRRGGSEDGSFSTGQHNLEKLEVNLTNEPESEVLEADEAPATRYSAPTIGEDEASNKVEVINSVLSSIREAFDRADGPGRGRAAFQLLIEGAPPKYQAIFDGVQVTEEGTLPTDELISNLLSRPAAQQRLLLTQALSDLIDRALSAAADDLPDEEVDALLETTAGYRGRLGL